MLWVALALAEPPIDALQAELDRSRSLSLPDAPPLYHLRYHLAEVEQRGIYASFGSLMRAETDPWHALGVELRVGEPGYDNTGFGGWENGFVRTALAEELLPIDVRQRAWEVTDRAYKQAVEQYARKRSQFSPPPDYPGDYTVRGGAVFDGGSRPLPAADPEEQIVRLSGLFRSAGAILLTGELHLGQEAGHVWMIDTEGSRVRRPLGETTLRAVASARTADGVLLTDSRLWSAQDFADLPDEPTLAAEITGMRDALVARTKTRRLEEEYVGPMIFEADAALDLYRYLLVPQLEGTPAEIPFDSFFGELGEQKSAVRVGRRVLPERWSAVDDPQGNPKHPSAFSVDWEGVPAERTELVDDGIVGDLLMSLVPRKGLRPNGHARGFVGTRASGRVAQLTVTAPRARSSAALRKAALKMAASYGRDHVMLVRRLQEPGILADQSFKFARMSAEDDEAKLPPPVEVVRLYADGREEVLHGVRFAFSDRFLLRDIALAGPSHTATFMAPFSGGYAWLGPTEGLPTQITAPDVLVREIELAPIGADPRDTPVLTAPE